MLLNMYSYYYTNIMLLNISQSEFNISSETQKKIVLKAKQALLRHRCDFKL